VIDELMRGYSVMGARVAYTAEAAFLEGLRHDGFIDAGEWAKLLDVAADTREKRLELPLSEETP